MSMISQEIRNIIKEAKKYLHDDYIEEGVIKAFKFAEKAHKEQVRHSGDPYIAHPVEAAVHLMSLHPDLESIQACLLHDVPEDTPITLKEIEQNFGKEVAMLTAGMEKLGKIKYRGEERAVENLKKMFLAMSKDLRVVLIKLCDRLHNMETIHFHPNTDKMIRIADETLHIYAPIAARLGMYNIKHRLEDLAFQVLYPQHYEDIIQQLENKNKEREKFVYMAKEKLSSILKKHNIEGRILGRVKTPYSIFKKLTQKRKTNIDDLYDIFALRILVEDKAACYTTLGIIHEYFTPLSHRFKDYIAVPKVNNYQSLHTTIIGLGKGLRNQATEVQIRTKEMNEEAQVGIASHFLYKENGRVGFKNSDLGWVKQLADISKGNNDNKEIMESIKMDLFTDRIFVLTPRGDVIDLPVGSTPVDFAYKIHTDIGHRCKGSKVEGNIVPLNYELKNGDIVEILTHKEPQPNQYWLSFMKSSEARSKLKVWFRNCNKEEIVKLGKEFLNKQLKRFSQVPLDTDLSLLSKIDGKNISLKERENILESIGNGSVNVVSVVKKIIPSFVKEKKEKIVELDSIDRKEVKVIISDEKNIKYKLAQCCSPEPYNDLVGYTTRGEMVSIHKSDCRMLPNLNQERFLPATWQQKKEKHHIAARVTLIITDQIGVLKEILEVVYRFQVNIIGISSMNRNAKRQQAELVFEFELKEYEVLDRLIGTLSVLDSVLDIDGEVLHDDAT